MTATTKRRPRKVLRWVIGMIVGLILLLYLLLPLGMAVVASLPARNAVGAPPPGAQEVALITADGVELAAWYAPPDNGAVIIVVHGSGNSRESMRAHIQMLRAAGYGVLALDARGHGASGGRGNRLGWQGTGDVGAAVAYLQTRPEVTRLGALGLSMGGEIVLGAAAAYPELRAIVAEGATRRSLAELLALQSERSLVRNWTARVMYAGVQLLTGQRPPQPLLEAMQTASATHFLLLAAEQVDLEVRFTEQFTQTLGARAEVWIVPATGHTQGLALHPEEYAQRVLAFFDARLLTP